jgi:hypothetical protein
LAGVNKGDYTDDFNGEVRFSGRGAIIHGGMYCLGKLINSQFIPDGKLISKAMESEYRMLKVSVPSNLMHRIRVALPYLVNCLL